MPVSAVSSLRLTPPNAAPGESVLVEALDAAGVVLQGSDIVINGIAGARQFLQFEGPGTFTVQAIAGDRTAITTAAITIEVAPPPVAAGEIPRRMPLLVARRVPDDRSPYNVQLFAVDTDHFNTQLSRIYADANNDVAALDTSTTIRSWTWDFGDGGTQTTSTPDVQYDFGANLAADDEHRLFDVTCTLTMADGSTSTVSRTLGVVNAYAVCRRMGVLAPPVTAVSLARKVLGTFEATLQVRNPEAGAVTVTRRRFIWGEADNEQSSAFEDLSAPLELAATAVTTVKIAVPFTTVPADVRSFTVIYLGSDPEGRVVHLEAGLDVPLPDHRTSGIRFGDLAFSRISAVGFEKVFAEANVVNPTAQAEQANPGIFHDSQWGQMILQTNQAPEIGALNIQNMPRANYVFAAQNASSMAAASTTLATVTEAAPFLHSVFRNKRLRGVVFEEPNAEVVALADIEVVASPWVQQLSPWAKELKAILTAPMEGQVCDPDNLPDAGEGWACQIVNDPGGAPHMIEWHRRARFLNARKGDLILAPGGPAGFIGGLLRQVVPPQRYAHIGIMTRNHDMITHCTFADERLKDYPVGGIDIPIVGHEDAPTDGFRPDVLRYGWPGTITQWVSGAVETGKLADPAVVADPASAVPGAPEAEVDARDPETQKTYKMSPFDRYPKVSANGTGWEVIPPLVVKPNVALETPEVRAALHRLADACRADTGKTHYSFFGYTDARKALTDTLPPGDQWPAGTYPAVCSSFVWAVARRLGMHLEGPDSVANPSDLEPSDAGIVEVDPGTPDGLYVYRADERGTAASWLHDRIRNQVLSTEAEKVRKMIGDLGHLDVILGGLIDVFTDMASDVANQMCNAFASDWCETAAKDSTAWSNPGEGIAVSPDDTMRWDGPDRDGFFGYAVPAVYAAASLESAPAYAWHFAPTTATVHGTVRVDGQPRGASLVQVTDLKTTSTHNDGTYHIDRVPFGTCEVKAQFDRGDGVLYNASHIRNLQQEDEVVDFDLTLRRDLYRSVHMTGDMYFMKYYTVGRNPRTEPPYPFGFDLAVTPDPTAMEARSLQRADFHSIFGVSSFLLRWLDGGAIQWAVSWAVCQDSNLADNAAWALTSAVDSLSLGFIDSLFGNEVKGADQRTGVMQPGEVVDDSMRIGPDDGSTGLFNFHLENRLL
jgi:hypothetical protein